MNPMTYLTIRDLTPADVNDTPVVSGAPKVSLIKVPADPFLNVSNFDTSELPF